ncbi:MAG TPA: porin [Opitutaceae bacterium]|nr:porin [Opitutaceae bacterium]
MNHPTLYKTLRSIAILAVASTATLRADEGDEIKELHAEIKALEQKLAAIEQREASRDLAVSQATQPAQAAVIQAPAVPTSKITVDDTGFNFSSADGSTFINLHGLVQGDSRWFFDNHGIANNNTFVVRRARLIYEGAFDKIFTYQIVPEFGGGGTGTSNAPVIYDANLGIAVTPEFQLRVGKFKSPVGLELLQNDAILLFNERSLATNLVASRDVGILGGGSIGGSLLNYTAGVVNGSADNAYTNNTDTDNNKDFVGRVFLKPFSGNADSVLSNLGFGVGASAGLQNKTGSLTSGYKTDGQQSFFTYRSTVVPEGSDWRVSPQANFYRGAFSAEAEYTVSAVTALQATSKEEIRNKGWQASIGYVLTGEKDSYNGFTPKNKFNWEAGTWGAFQVGLRVANLKIDSDAFPIFADPGASASEATSYGASLNWFLSKAIRVSFDAVQTDFERAPGAKTTTNALIGGNEQAFLTRFQVGF